MTTKVKETQSYNDLQGSHFVCKGKLVLLREHSEHGYYKGGTPFIISEIEKIEDGDWVLKYGKELVKSSEANFNNADFFNAENKIHNTQHRKVLALPDNFSVKQLKAIVDGKFKDSDECYIKCEVIGYEKVYFKEEPRYGITWFPNIKLFPVKKKEESWDEVIIHSPIHFSDGDLKTMVQWLKDNYNPPTKKI